MTKHTYAFFISIFFHILFFALLYYFYTLFTKEKHADEKMISVRLNELVISREKTPLPEPKKQHPPRKVEKQIKSPVKKKIEKVEKKAEVKKLHSLVQPKSKAELHRIIPVSKPTQPEQKQEQESVQSKKMPDKTEEKPKPRLDVVNVPLINEEQRQKKLEKEFLDENMIKITKLLEENLYYPRSARKRGVTGEVSVVFCININGEVTDVEIENSNSEILSRAAKKTILNLSGEFPKPKEKLVLHLPICYRLD